MLATAAEDELQLTNAVRFCVLLLLKVPIAVNCCDVPSGIVAVAGVTAMDVRTGAVTVKVEDPAMVPEVAVIVVAP
jgi:hypothetical protein